jgi:hypothetical protein
MAGREPTGPLSALEERLQAIRRRGELTPRVDPQPAEHVQGPSHDGVLHHRAVVSNM